LVYILLLLAESGDQPLDLKRDLPKVALDEMMKADKKIIHEMSSSPYWDWNEETRQWGWARPPPESQSNGQSTLGQSTGKRKKRTEQERALLEMVCGICKNVLQSPVSAPCSHAFCKPCLDKRFGGQAFEINTGAVTGRSMRVRKVAMPCPSCKADLADFLKTAQINRDMEALIVKLQKEVADLNKDTTADQLQTDQLQEQDESCIREEEIVKDKMPMVENIETNKPAHVLCLEFPEFDRELIESLIEQEEGDIKAVSAALSRMQNHMRAEERKKSKAAKGTEDGVLRKKKKLASPQ
jgi:hypothetical protein